jgi:hypothetical protein
MISRVYSNIVLLLSMMVGFIIRALKEDPLPTGMFDVFFKKINIIRVFVESTQLN